MSSVLQGGRRRRRAGRGLARLLMLLLVIGAVVAIVAVVRHHKTSHPVAHAPVTRSQVVPGATPSPGTAAPDPAQAALAGVDAFRLRFHEPPRAGMVFDVKTGQVLW